MTDVRLYADESGNFDFSRRQGASRYFVLTSVTLTSEADRALAAELRDLRFSLISRSLPLAASGCFHATEDKQVVRNEVFAVLQKHEFRIDATILEKSKAAPRIRPTDERFYQHAWYFHLKHVGPKVRPPGGNLLISAAALGTRAKKRQFREAVESVAAQVTGGGGLTPTSWEAKSELCLQVADYCCWAIARRWEREDPRSYDLIKAKIASEYDLFKRGKTHYY